MVSIHSTAVKQFHSTFSTQLNIHRMTQFFRVGLPPPKQCKYFTFAQVNCTACWLIRQPIDWLASGLYGQRKYTGSDESRTFEEGKQYDNNNNPRWLFTFHSQCAVITPLFYATLLLEMPSSIGCKYYVHEEPIKGTVQIIYICNTNSSKL